MSQGMVTAGMLIGGLGLFLLAIEMVTDGLKQAAGHSLRDLLGKWTRTPGHGILSGIAITGIVQSSSAVTVATIGFVNAGLLTMYQALGVVYGANIGTTMTGWLVAIIGFKIKVEIFALPMIGIGMLLKLTGSQSRRASIGTALAGFGLFFIGIDVLKDAFEGMATAFNLAQFKLEGVTGVLIYVGIGFMMTVLTQSSSAAIAITLTAATGGILGLYAAAAMVIGANIGTTSTAALAVIGATPNAKRVAGAHVVFNLLTGVVALLILPVMFWLIQTTGKVFRMEDIPAVTLAMFHTIFNILGVLLMWPISKRLAQFLEKRFVTVEEVESRPRYLDKTVAVSPILALNALVLEMSRIVAVTRRMALAALSAEKGPGKRIATDHAVVDNLTSAVAAFVARLGQGVITEEVSGQLAKLLQAEQYLLASSDLALEISKAQAGLKFAAIEELEVQNARYRSEVVQLMELVQPEVQGFSIVACEAQLEQVQISYDEAKTALLNAGSEQDTPIPDMIDILEQNSRIRRMARQTMKAMRCLNELYVVTEAVNPDMYPVSNIN